MNRFLPHLLLHLLVADHLATASPEYSEPVKAWPVARLVISEDFVVDDLFVPGLQPFWNPTSERRNLHCKHAHIQVVERSGTELPFIPTDVLRASVLAPNLISSLQIWTPPLTVDEARSEMRKWLPFTNKTEEELDEFLAAVKEDWLQYDVVDGYTDVIRFASGWSDPDDMKMTVSLIKSWQWQAPLRFQFNISAMMKTRYPVRLIQGPIPPPPGVDAAELVAPRNWEADDRFVPLTTEPRPPQGTLPPKYQAMNEAAAVPSAKSLPDQEAVEPEVPQESSPGESKTVLPWMVSLAIVAGFSLIVWTFRARLRRPR